MQRTAEHAAEEAVEDADPDTSVQCSVCPEPGGEDHLAFEADVYDARTLRPQTTETGQRNRDTADDHGAYLATRCQVVLVVEYLDEGEYEEQTQQHVDEVAPGWGPPRPVGGFGYVDTQTSICAHAAAP